MTSKVPVVAIVGRTNVGKSTLFNAFARRRLAVVHDSDGVTRDRAYIHVSSPFPMMLVDTGGLFGDLDSDLQDVVRAQAELAIAESDLVICVFDGVAGPHPYDEEVVALLRRIKKPILWVVNKCEKEVTQQTAHEFYGLGLDNLIFVSAAHRQGVRELREAIKETLGIEDTLTVEEEEAPERDRDNLFDEAADLTNEETTGADTETPDRPVLVALIGRPNVGKSSLINRIVGEDRLVTADAWGTTRDSVDVSVKRDGQDFTFIDTAGLRKKARIDDQSVERYSALRSLRAIARADVVVLVLDATQGVPSIQDARIAGLIHERGKPLVIVVNKWDAIEKDHKTVHAYKHAIQHEFKFARYAPILFVSALSGRRCPSLFPQILEVWKSSRQRVQTSELNKILSRAFERRPPPVYHGEPVKLFFATQVGVTPPTFVLFVNHTTKIKFFYIRYLKNVLREHFPFPGSDIRVEIRKRRGDRNESKAVGA
jgi:GTPase